MLQTIWRKIWKALLTIFRRKLRSMLQGRNKRHMRMTMLRSIRTLMKKSTMMRRNPIKKKRNLRQNMRKPMNSMMMNMMTDMTDRMTSKRSMKRKDIRKTSLMTVKHMRKTTRMPGQNHMKKSMIRITMMSMRRNWQNTMQRSRLMTSKI